MLLAESTKTASPLWWDMTPDRWVQTVSGLLIMLMVWLLKKFVEDYRKAVDDLKNIHQNTVKELKEEHTKDRQLMVIECAQYRADHREDMKTLFEDARRDRENFQLGMKEIASAIRDMKDDFYGSRDD